MVSSVVTLQTQLDHGSSIPPSSSEILGVISQHGLKWQAGPLDHGRSTPENICALHVCMFICLSVFVYSVYSVCVCVCPPSLYRLAYICMYTRRCKFSCSILCLFNYIYIYIYIEKIYVVQYSMICIILYDDHIIYIYM